MTLYVRGRHTPKVALITREETRYVACPECHARATEPCVGVRGEPRTANHRGRIRYASRILSTRAPRGDAADRYLRDHH